ncbi:hypothetical protein [Lachnoanaerobaculum umeaense]|uniref:Uncharacterized protein n=1 Tax=Lachnoanaerobaculum umeaense TaxID=617123 RepID=A0A385Q1E8_9FIRM|nr:hypothetical protein [Lachnoanaerobaculum umeaense]AYB00046.1 hypothetical protein D4A81_08860 [Lachnoanaerobaculum umeaense]PZW97452.1 hypothetical protein C7439_10966 [Lachnoanaerobaculum umeaense]
MSKLILKDKTEIELSTHYGDTYVTVIENFAKLDELKDKLTDANTVIMTVQSDGSEETVTGLKLQGITINFVKDETGVISQIQALLMFRAMDKVEQVEATLTGRIDALSNMLVELMSSDEEGEGNEQ